MKRFPAPADEHGRLTLLLGHLRLMAQPTDAAYSMLAPHPQRDPRKWSLHRETHLAGLSRLMQVLAPNEQMTWDTPRNRAIAMQALCDAWHSVVINAKRKTVRAAEAVKLAEDLLVHSPVATACYINEVVPVLRCPADALVLIARAAQHASGPPDNHILSGALENVTRYVTEKLQSPGVTTPPKKSSRSRAPEKPHLPAIFTSSQTQAIDQIRPMAASPGHLPALSPPRPAFPPPSAA